MVYEKLLKQKWDHKPMASGFAIRLRSTGLKRGREWGEKWEDCFFFLIR